jgi:hypothetical protein
MPDLRQRLPRVAYSAPVRLSGEWSDREPWFVPLLAQSLDLSEGGMALVTPLHLRLGASVTCSMRLGGQQAYLVGRVVWDRLAPDGTKRVGIQFLSPSEQETSLMRRLLAVGQSHPHRVNLRFDGRPDTMTALARVTSTGITLSAPLPILRRDTRVRFAFEGLGPTFTGKVDRVRVAHLQGMPALHIGIRVNHAHGQVAVPPPSPAPSRASSEARKDATPTAVEVPITTRKPAGGRRRARALPSPAWLALWLCALGAGALGYAAWRRQPVERATPTIEQTRTAVSGLRTGGFQPALLEPPQLPAVVSPLPPPAAESFQPTFKWRRDRRELFVPLAGKLEALRHFRLRRPSGIAIDVPHARGAAGGARYPVRHPGVSRIDVAPWKNGTRIRIWVQQSFADYRLQTEPAGIRIILPVER